MSARILEALAVAAEMTGTELSKPAMRAMEMELDEFDEAAVLAALSRCRRELRHRMTLADILDRIQGADGRPSADEAWATALKGMDEAETVILNDEIAEGLRVARPIHDAGDLVGARMAFRQAYERIVADNRERKVPVSWWPSLGHDPHKREAVIADGVRLGLLPRQAPTNLLPPPPATFDEGEPAGRHEIGEKLRALALSLKAPRAR